MKAALEGAAASIEIDHFIFKAGGIGDEIMDILSRKAQSGVRVRLLLDAIGSAELASGSLVKMCRDRSIELRFFNSILPLTISHNTPLFFRDHQKLIIVDGHIAMTGGVCIDERMRHWRDSMLLVTDEGLAKQMRSVFEHMWARAHKERLVRLTLPLGTTRYLLDIPFSPKRPAYRAMRRAIRGAKMRVLLETPYFVPPHRVLRILRSAARRGVQVSLVLPTRSDARLVDLAAESYFATLLEAGVRIYRYERTTLHAKAYVVDQSWGMLGSHNLDRLSFEYNFEGSIVTSDPTLVQDIAQSLETDISHSTEILPDVWQRRGIIRRIKEVLVFPLRFFL